METLKKLRVWKKNQLERRQEESLSRTSIMRRNKTNFWMEPNRDLSIPSHLIVSLLRTVLRALSLVPPRIHTFVKLGAFLPFKWTRLHFGTTKIAWPLVANCLQFHLKCDYLKTFLRVLVGKIELLYTVGFMCENWKTFFFFRNSK